jgi:hypothetical protein
LTVSKPGPNEGRTFFACSLGKGEPGRKKSGCGFFKWEDLDQVPILRTPNFSSKGFWKIFDATEKI